MKVFINAKIYPVVGDIIDKGLIRINENGKIEEISREIKIKENEEVVDLEGKIIIPGLVDGHTHIGMWGDGEGSVAKDGNEWTKAISGGVRALDSVNPRQISFESAREGGITSVQILPGSGNPIGGLAFACKTSGDLIDEMIIKSPTGLKGALGENPKNLHGSKGNTPASRMGTASLIRSFFMDAKNYGEKKEKAKEKGSFFKSDLNLEAGLMVLNKEIPFRIHAHRHDDIVTGIRICEEFDIDYSIEHCTDGHKIADYLASKGVKAMVGPGLSNSVKLETSDFTDDNPALLSKEGIKLCLMTDHPFLNCKYFLHYGAISHKNGLDFNECLKAMTINPAEVIGIDDRVGSLEKGKDGDFVVLNGEPFSSKGFVVSTYIEGKLVWHRDLTL